MKYCDQCGAKLSDKAKFCSACGTSIGVSATKNTDMLGYLKRVASLEKSIYTQVHTINELKLILTDWGIRKDTQSQNISENTPMAYSQECGLL